MSHSNTVFRNQPFFVRFTTLPNTCWVLSSFNLFTIFLGYPTKMIRKASVELLNVNLEAEGQRIACGSLPLGPVATPITPSQNTTEGSDEVPDTTAATVTAEVDGSSATG